MRTSSGRTAIGIACTVLLFTAAGCGGDDDTTTTTAPPVTVADDTFQGDLVGTFAIDPGLCSDFLFLGSAVRFVLPGDSPETGPFIDNPDSPCDDQTFTALVPGSDGGLRTATFQEAPDPAFDEDGNGLASAIIAPVPVAGSLLGAATDPDLTLPSITSTEGILSGDLSALTAYYRGASAPLGAPQPDGSGDGVTGLIHLVRGRFLLEWTSVVEGGPFDGYTAIWHLEGTFVPG